VTAPFLVPKVLPVKRQTPGEVIFSFIIWGLYFQINTVLSVLKEI
jgi:hypothetical protein